MKERTKNGNYHLATSNDSTQVAARVLGKGPHVIFLPAGPGDSELSWSSVAEWMSKHCTCHLLETRGRGQSGDHPDHSPNRLVEDVLAYAHSIGEKAAVVGWGSALWARVASQNPEEIVAAAVYEPGAGEVMTPETGKRMGETFGRVGELAAEGKTAEAARVFIDNCDMIYSQEDIDSGAPANFWSDAAEQLPLFMQESRQASGSGPGATSPETLGKIKAPVLILLGERTSRWFSDSVQHVVGHISNSTLQLIPGAAHFGPITHAEAVAGEMARFIKKIHAEG